ncbi:hypothetical protein DFH06DRAFT_1330542 [Mycena polygramma]|nr:hypothetical protein DFH06DRAFT_1330542 [Mycena polygramma]
MNSTITDLIVMPSESLQNNLDYSAVTFGSIHMPKLESFQGPGTVACSILSGSRTSRFTIYWEPRSDFSRVLAAVEASNGDVIELSSMVYFWDHALLAAIAKHTPRIEELNIQYMKNHHGREDIFSALEHTLHSLPRLVLFRVTEIADIEPDRVDEGLESEFEAMRKWGEMFPNIRCATLMTATPWTRFCHPLLSYGVWYPGNFKAPDVARHLKWWITKVLMSPDLPNGYAILAECLVGEEFRTLKGAMRRDGVVPAFDILSSENGQPVISFPSST